MTAVYIINTVLSAVDDWKLSKDNLWSKAKTQWF